MIGFIWERIFFIIMKETKNVSDKKLIFILKNNSGFFRNRLKILILEYRLGLESKIGLNNKKFKKVIKRAKTEEKTLTICSITRILKF